MSMKIGFVGLGNIGQPMALQLLRSGFEVSVFDIRHDVMSPVEAAGATVVAKPSDTAPGSRIICVAVLDDAQVEEVVLGANGILSVTDPGSVILIHSTVSPQVCQRIADQARAREVGVVDAPVSGAAGGAEQGTLTLLVGGEATHVTVCAPVFSALGKQVFHIGPVGMGQVAKLCNNVMFTVNLRAALEALELARAAGIDEDLMREIAAACTGQSWPLEHLDEMRTLIEQPRQSVSAQVVGNKDLALAVDLGQSVGVEMPITDAAIKIL